MFNMNSKQNVTKTTHWERILSGSSISKEFEKWYNDPQSSTTFQIPNSVFKELNLRPVRMIPHYHQIELPEPLTSRQLELFRNEKGGCVVTKTGYTRAFSSIFPRLPQCDLVTTNTFTPVSQLSLLFRNESLNEDNYFFLAQRIGVLEHFLKTIDTTSSNIPLEHCGRLRSVVSGGITIGKDHVLITNALLETDHILENDDMIVILELKKSFSESMSLHQVLLPYIYLQNQKEQRKIYLIYFEAKPSPSPTFYTFRLHLLTFKDISQPINICNYTFPVNIEYSISL